MKNIHPPMPEAPPRAARSPSTSAGAGASASTGVWRGACAVFVKDWRGEWRTRAALNAIALFALATPIALSLGIAGQKLSPQVLAGLLWANLLLAALIGLSRVWVKEDESGTATLLRLHARPECVLWGKTAWNVSLLAFTQAGAVPVFAILLGAPIESPLLLLATLVLADIGLATASSLLGAMTMGATGRGTLFCAVAIPILLPLLVIAANATAVAFGGGGDWRPALQALVAYDVAMLAAAWMLFDFVWN
jgi:heme exporter protein B